MPKKSFKKQRSLQLRAKRRTQKAAKMAAYARSQLQRQANRSSARDLKELNRILDTVNSNNGNNGNNGNNENNLVTTLPLETVNNNNNNEPFVGPEWNVNQPSFGRVKRRVPSKTMKKEKRNRLLTRKQKQKQRNLSLRRARLSKQEERNLETASLPSAVNENANVNANENENANLIGNFGMPHFGNNGLNYYNIYNNGINYNALERQEAEQELQAMRDKMANAQKDRFYIRLNREKRLYTPYEIYRMIRQGYSGPRYMEILYLSKNPRNSYYYEYVKHDEEDDEYTYNSGGRYRRIIYSGWKVYKKDPIEYFRPYFTPHYYNFYGPNENEFDRNNIDFANNDNTIIITSKEGLLRHLKRLPQFQEEREKDLLRLSTEKAEKVRYKGTAPAKLKELQLKGIEGWIQQMEGKTGMTMPQNVQNIIERGIRPVDYRYYQGRDNLQRIKSNLFDNQADVPRHLKKVSTNLFH